MVRAAPLPPSLLPSPSSDASIASSAVFDGHNTSLSLAGARSQFLRRKRVCVIGESVHGVPDEGVTKSTQALARALQRKHDVTLLSITRGTGERDTGPAPISVTDAPRIRTVS